MVARMVQVMEMAEAVRQHFQPSTPAQTCPPFPAADALGYGAWLTFTGLLFRKPHLC
jgi:hypothetical protein